MNDELENALSRLSPSQRDAVNWDQGAALVLAGPGVGKTTVLTTRIARILDESREKNFRILALTFTTKAGDEMRARVEALVPDQIDRTVIGTFHGFCAQILRQHGSHLAIKPTFGIYDQDSDREELLRDALRRAQASNESVSEDDVRWLKTIDRLRSNLVSPEKTAARFKDMKLGAHIATVYRIYEDALRAADVTDFNGMILDTCRLAVKVPAVAARIRQSYRYWMIDEFQDTTPAQYRMVRFLAGDEFRNLFVVADDDQIIYQFAGASYGQIVSFREHFQPTLMQLVENRRCPPDVVAAANNVIARNSDRTPHKAPLVAAREGAGGTIRVMSFDNDTDEANGITAELVKALPEVRGSTAILARTRAILGPVLEALKAAHVPAIIVARRDRFVSPQFAWLHSALELTLRPTDKQMFVAMAAAANRVAHVELDAALIAAEADASSTGYLEAWSVKAAKESGELARRLATLASTLVQSRSAWLKVVTDALTWLPQTTGAPAGVETDADDDKAAWDQAYRAIKQEKGSVPDLDEFLQGLALRPKEPPLDPAAVKLITIHSAKGLEFDHVWLMGAAESVLPSWQSLKADAKPTELEEERRNFFVAITRTQKTLTISHARTYRGWQRAPSRFLEEMRGAVASS